jgi:adenosylcobinamide-GDP ribazoletransferase
LGRTLILLLFLTTPYVRAGGLASAVTEHLPRQAAGWITTGGLLLSASISSAGILLALLGFWLLRRIMLQRLQGCTGDTAGASVESGEMFWLLGASLVIA